jgi:hypothetical protein
MVRVEEIITKSQWFSMAFVLSNHASGVFDIVVTVVVIILKKLFFKKYF